MTGIGFLRFAEKHDLRVISFVDSDPALNKKRWKGVKYGFLPYQLGLAEVLWNKGTP